MAPTRREILGWCTHSLTSAVSRDVAALSEVSMSATGRARSPLFGDFRAAGSSGVAVPSFKGRMICTKTSASASITVPTVGETETFSAGWSWGFTPVERATAKTVTRMPSPVEPPS
jgi:hypothetical protein